MGVLTVKLPPSLDARLDALLNKRGQTKSALVREAIERLVEADDAPGATLHDSLKDLIGTGRGPKDLSTNPKHMRGYGE